MSILCKIFGHVRLDQHIRTNGWSKSHNDAYDHHQVGYTCHRCCSQITVGIIATNKDRKID